VVRGVAYNYTGHGRMSGKSCLPMRSRLCLGLKEAIDKGLPQEVTCAAYHNTASATNDLSTMHRAVLDGTERLKRRKRMLPKLVLCCDHRRT